MTIKAKFIYYSLCERCVLNILHLNHIKSMYWRLSRTDDYSEDILRVYCVYRLFRKDDFKQFFWWAQWSKNTNFIDVESLNVASCASIVSLYLELSAVFTRMLPACMKDILKTFIWNCLVFCPVHCHREPAIVLGLYRLSKKCHITLIYFQGNHHYSRGNSNASPP